MLHVTEQQVIDLLPMKEAVRLMREAFAGLRAGTAINQPRRRMMLPTGSVLHSMGGAIGKYFGTKVYSTNPKGAHFFFLLFDSASGSPVAQFEADHLGQIRTGAATGYATDILSAPDAATLAIIGSGFQARSQLDAIREVRKLREVRVWSRSESKRAEFAKETGARATATAEEAIRGAEIVVTSTSSKDPVLDASWVADGAHVTAMGSNRPQWRELPSELINRADLIVCDSIDQAKIEAGDLLLVPVDWSDKRIVELAQVEKRPAGSPLTIFKSGGLGLEDVIAAAYIYERLA